MFKYPINVTIDTNVLDAAKYDLSKGSTLDILRDYVDEGKIKIILSNIVIKESKNHLKKQVNKICTIARKSRKDILEISTEHLVKHLGYNHFLEIEKNKKTLIKKSEELFDSFVLDLKAEILTTDLIDLDLIINDYFEIKPPFEEGEKKRKEFPDAFIAQQIRQRFGETEDVAIISSDNGFKAACKSTNNHYFFNSLGELYNAISKDEETYSETQDIIQDLQCLISNAILDYINKNENIDVRGLSYDKDGIPSGYDYDEFYLENVTKPSFKIHSIEKLSENTSTVTILCESKFVVDCYYEDYDNAPWDYETKEYVFVDTIGIREKHNARFACRIEVDRKKKTFDIYPFTVVLGGDSLTDRYKMEEYPSLDLDKELIDMNRESVGLKSFGSYESYLEDNLSQSQMLKDIVYQFENLNKLYILCEDICASYNDFLEYLNNSKYDLITIKNISKSMTSVPDFPKVLDENNIKDYEIERIKDWINAKIDILSEISEYRLPDIIDYDTSIDIMGINQNKIVFSIDPILININEGNQEIINISLSSEEGIIANGNITLTIGYINYNDNGNVSEGLDDNIDYNYTNILKNIEKFVNTEQIKVNKEFELINIIDEAIKVTY